MKWAQSLIRIANFEVEMLQKRVVEIVDRRWAVEMQIAGLDAEREAERASKALYAEEGFYLAGFEEGVRIRRAALLVKLAELEVEESGARDALAEAFEVLKKYEHVLDAAEVAKAKERARRETAELDEMGLRRASK